MPAASCRISPARSINRCDTISASLGFSLRIGRRKRESRMGTPKESVRHRESAVKPDQSQKYKGGDQQKPLTKRIPCHFTDGIDRPLWRRSTHADAHIFMPECSGVFLISIWL